MDFFPGNEDYPVSAEFMQVPALQQSHYSFTEYWTKNSIF